MGLRVWEGEREGGWGRGGPAHLDRSPALQDRAGERKPLGDGEHRDSADGRVAEAWVAFVLSTRNARNPSHRRRCRHRGPCDRQKGCFSLFSLYAYHICQLLSVLIVVTSFLKNFSHLYLASGPHFVFFFLKTPRLISASGPQTLKCPLLTKSWSRKARGVGGHRGGPPAPAAM